VLGINFPPSRAGNSEHGKIMTQASTVGALSAKRRSPPLMFRFGKCLATLPRMGKDYVPPFVRPDMSFSNLAEKWGSWAR